MRIREYIDQKNSNGEKVLNVFLTAGFPKKEKFVDLALSILDSGADMLEIGFPFSDPLADGPVIQFSSQSALENGVTLKETFSFAEQIKKHTDKPVILMGYANPAASYGKAKFAESCKQSGVSGLIIPDVPLDEYDDFYLDSFADIDVILLATPTSSVSRLKKIDKLSRGFLYYVSMAGTTGNKIVSREKSIEQLKQVSQTITENKILTGFGISSPEDAKEYSQHCSGVIVGSAVIKSLISDSTGKSASQFVKNIKNSI